ncbi:MAG: outer membrane protein assembly factor BamB, partial [Enterobacterales bacterium]|nr:outer membrane protein assembly factor BamB [Enterobacterales bacterium]
MTKLKVLLPLLLLVTGGCSWFGDDEEDAFRPAELQEIEEQFEADILWSRSVGDGVGEYYNKLKPVVYDGKVFVADANGLVKAFNEKTGELVWETEVESEIYGGVAAGSKLVALGSTDAEVIVLNSETGEEQWRNLVSSEVVSAPVISDGKVVARTIDGKLFAMDSKTGERAWLYDRTVPALTLRGTSSLTASRGAVVTGFANGKIALFLIENGRAVWEKRVASATGRSELDRVVDIDATPIMVGDTIYAVTFNGNVAAFDVRGGEAKWQREMSSLQDLAVSGQLLSVVDARSKVRDLDRRT